MVYGVLGVTSISAAFRRLEIFDSFSRIIAQYLMNDFGMGVDVMMASYNTGSFPVFMTSEECAFHFTTQAAP